jgi:hypothetical protein
MQDPTWVGRGTAAEVSAQRSSLHAPHLDKVVVRAGDDVAARAVKGDAVNCKAVPAQGMLVAQLLHMLLQ